MILSPIAKGQVWEPDNGDGTYKNPIIYADYSDPDVIRVGDNYYMVSSSFTCQPGLPVLQSKDLVHWKIINHVYQTLPLDRYKTPQHGQGSWAPSIRYHDGKFYVYFCTPEDGLFMAFVKDPAKKWTLTYVKQVNGWEDPCPFWDEDGKAYLIHGKVGAGPAILNTMSPDGKKILDEGTIIYQDKNRQPILEGFKFMDKRDGYYYFLAPAGGVKSGWQSAFRSKNIYGPYEDKIVMQQGNTEINGPHQGGLVQTQTGEWWFIHFQDKGAYGRIVLLEPATWDKGWPVIGLDKDGSGIGNPVLSYKKPNVGKEYPAVVPQTSDDFSGRSLGLQWQWQAAPNEQWYSLSEKKGFIRLRAISVQASGNFAFAGNLLLQKFMAPSFTATTRLEFHGNEDGDRAGLAIINCSYICMEKKAGKNRVVLYEQKQKGWINLSPPKELQSFDTDSNTVWFRVQVYDNATCSFSYSFDGLKFLDAGTGFNIRPGTWIGAKLGIFCIDPTTTPSLGYADFDYFQVK